MTLASAIPLKDRFKLFTNGQQVIQAVENILNNNDATQNKQPVSLIILDINMPIMDGMETAKRIKQLYDDYNEMLAKSSLYHHGLVRPFLCHLTQFDKTFKTFMQPEETGDLFLNKPLPHSELVSLLRLLNLY